MLLIFAVFMGCLLTKATLSHLVILALFYIPVSGQLHPLSYTISYLWPADLLPGWNMIYVIRALCILVLSVLLTWILIKLGRLLIKITDPFFSMSDYGLRHWIKHCGYLPWCYYEFYVYPEYHLHFAGNYLPSNLPSHRRIFPASGRKSATFISAGNRKQLSQLYF